MKKTTIQETNKKTIQAFGWTQIESRTSKALTFTHPQGKQKIFLGSRGSVRTGQSYTKSFARPHMIERFALYHMILTDT